MPTKIQIKSCSPDCGLAKSAQILGDVWILLIINQLFSGQKRFNEIQEQLSGISKSVLSQRLKNLESKNLILRSQIPRSMPPQVYYSLTKKGENLHKIMYELTQFGLNNL
jgi:DNA-binding HxlR family transcriptional regulator